MLSYRQIQTEKLHRKAIWRSEKLAPRIFRDASDVWTPTYRSFVEFWRSCGEIWGLFDGEDLTACVYLQFGSPAAANIHLSVVREVPEPEIVRFFQSLTRHKAAEGIRYRTAWILERNRFLVGIALATGYRPTGLKMDFGGSRGRLLRWIEVQG